MKLIHSFTVILTADGDEELLRRGVNRFAGIFSRRYGGATVVSGEGGWISSDGELIYEPNRQVQVFSDESPQSIYALVRDDLVDFFSRAEQEAVAVIADGVMYVFDTDNLPKYLP